MKGTSKSILILSFLLLGGLALPPATALADDKGRQGKQKVERQKVETHRDRDRHKSERRRDDNRHAERRHVEERRVIRVERPKKHRRPAVYKQRKVVVLPDRYYRGIRVYRPYGYRYPGFGFYYSDNDAFRWLAFTAISLAILNNINEQQQRLHEQAQIRATTARVGETIIWEDGNASGSVTTTRVGTSTSGRQCREFQQTVTIGGKSEQAWGTACLQPDGSWELVK